MNPITILEISVGILAIAYLLTISVPQHFNVKYYIFEDLYASLISISYQNYSTEKVCNVVREIIPPNYKYLVLENGNEVCGNNVVERVGEISHFIEYNGTVYNITIIIGK